MDLSRSVVAYKVFRNIHLDEESYSVQLELKHGLDDEESEQVILEAVDEGFLDMVKDSDPRRYKLNLDKFAEEWYELWGEVTGDRPDTPQNFDSFIENYAQSYMEEEKHSTLREMMVEEFYIALNTEATEAFLTSDFRELRDRLNNDYKGKRTPVQHFKYALNNR